MIPFCQALLKQLEPMESKVSIRARIPPSKVRVALIMKVCQSFSDALSISMDCCGTQWSMMSAHCWKAVYPFEMLRQSNVNWVIRSFYSVDSIPTSIGSVAQMLNHTVRGVKRLEASWAYFRLHIVAFFGSNSMKSESMNRKLLRSW